MTINIGQKTFISSIFTLAGQWVKRLLGVISIIILARILSPDDYGVVAIAQLSILFFQMLLADGSRAYLIRKQNISNEDYDTAWSIRLVLFSLIAMIIFFGRGAIADFFNEPRLISVLYVLSIGFFLSGFQNIGQVVYEKKLEYKKIFWFQLSVKLVGFVVTVSLALYLQNYWALIIGLVSMQVATLLMSYNFFEYRPRFTFSKINEQWQFSKWILLGNFSVFIRNKLDQMLISKYLGANELGLFVMTYQLSDMPYTEIVEPINKVVYSSYSSSLNNKEKLAELFVKVVGVMCIISFPLYSGLVVLSEDIVFLLLGNKWLYVNTLIPVIVLLLVSQTISLLAGNMLTVLGKVKMLALLNWIMVFIMIPMLIYAISYKDLYLFVWVRVLLAVSFIPAIYLLLFKFFAVKKYPLIMAIIRPLIASIIMVLMIRFFHGFFNSLPIMFSLLLEILMGVIIYTISLILQWLFSGKSLGGEEYILDKISFISNKNSFLKKHLSARIEGLLKR